MPGGPVQSVRNFRVAGLVGATSQIAPPAGRRGPGRVLAWPSGQVDARAGGARAAQSALGESAALAGLFSRNFAYKPPRG
jgi:hypothetical protein